MFMLTYFGCTNDGMAHTWVFDTQEKAQKFALAFPIGSTMVSRLVGGAS